MPESSARGSVAVVAGIRSQFIKLAGLQRGVDVMLADRTLSAAPVYVNAGQHYDEFLSHQYLGELGIAIDIDLTQEAPARHPIDMTSDMLRRLFYCFEELRGTRHITGVVVFGDANTTLAASVAARKAGLQLAHVEAGVRTFEHDSPEEINRITADALADLHFASTRRDQAFLEEAGFGPTSTYVGDLVHDLVVSLPTSVLSQPLPYASSGYVLVTLHREENTQDADALFAIAGACAAHNLPAVLIRHPRTARLIAETKPLWGAGLTVVDSLPYIEFLRLVKNATAIITDSGALQRESYYLGKRCLIRQDNVFWPTLVAASIHRLVEGRPESVSAGLAWLQSVRGEPLPELDDFGVGNAGQLIFQSLVDHGWLPRP